MIMFLKNLQTVSGFFFFLLGSAYFCLALLLQNGYENPYFYVAFNTMDMPFAFVALLYAVSSMKMSFIEHDMESGFWNVFIILFAFALFSVVIYINFFLS